MASTEVAQDDGKERTGTGDESSKMTKDESSSSNRAENTTTTTDESSSAPPKHPLQYRWVLWYCKQDKSKEWEDCLKEVASFDTVEDFWALYNHIQVASGLSFGSDYYLFKEGIRPMWEDVHNVEGGRWLIHVDKTRRNELLDHYWLELLMAVVGEQFDDLGEFVCGAVVNVRNKGDKVSLWTKDARENEVNRRIGSIAKQKLGIADSIAFEEHKENVGKSGSTVRARLRV